LGNCSIGELGNRKFLNSKEHRILNELGKEKSISKFPNSKISKSKEMSKKIDFVRSLKDLSESDLRSRIHEDELRLKKLEFAHAISPLENPMSVRGLRRDLARLKTELQKRLIGA